MVIEGHVMLGGGGLLMDTIKIVVVDLLILFCPVSVIEWSRFGIVCSADTKLDKNVFEMGEKRRQL